jgi:hypothetical protein
MRKESKRKIGALLVVATLAGCVGTVTSSVTETTCVTQPVLLGKVKRMHEADHRQWNIRVPFSIENHSYMASGGCILDLNPRYSYLHRKINEENVYVELLKLVGSPDDKIAIHEVYIRSYAEDSRIILNGGIYRADETGSGAGK